MKVTIGTWTISRAAIESAIESDDASEADKIVFRQILAEMAPDTQSVTLMRQVELPVGHAPLHEPSSGPIVGCVCGHRCTGLDPVDDFSQHAASLAKLKS